MTHQPIACSLTAAELADRRLAWRRIAGEAGLGSERTLRGVRLRYRGSETVFADLSVLVDLERECCPWMAGSVSRAGDEVVVEFTADGEDGPRAVAAMVAVG